MVRAHLDPAILGAVKTWDRRLRVAERLGVRPGIVIHLEKCPEGVRSRVELNLDEIFPSGEVLTDREKDARIQALLHEAEARLRAVLKVKGDEGVTRRGSP